MSRATLEISMIVKDGAATLARTIASVAPAADRILVGDTGSLDNTIEVAHDAGAEVVAIPWEQDFAKARNRVLAMGRCDWILSIDADEMLDEEGPEKLTALLQRPEIDAYDVVRWNYVRQATARSSESAPQPNPGTLPAARAFPAYATSVNTRLFRRMDGIYFEHAVHETVIGRLATLGKTRAPADFILHHLGQAEDDEQVRQQKNELYHQLGLKKLKETPQLPSAWFEVGLSQLEYRKRPDEALLFFEKARALGPNQPRNSLFCGICLTALNRLSESLDRLHEAYRIGLRSPVLFEAIGDVHFHAGRYEQARQAYTHGGASPLNAAKLGACETVLLQPETGLARIQRAIDDCPNFVELYDILTTAALLAGKAELANQSAARRLSAQAGEGKAAAADSRQEPHLAYASRRVATTF